MSSTKRTGPRVAAEWLALALVATVVGAVWLCLASFNRDFTPGMRVTLVSQRSGLIMEPYSKVKMRGVQVGHVATVSGGSQPVSLTLAIDRDQVKNIPANVQARIDATSLFGSKFVDLVYPEHPSRQRLTSGAVLTSQNVAVEINTVFQNLVTLLKQIDPAKLNSVLSALAQGLGGQGERLGEATTESNEVLTALNARTDTLRQDFRAVKNVGDVYSRAAQNIVNILDAASTTSTTVASQAKQLDSVLAGVAGLSASGIDVLGPNKDNLIKAIDRLQPTTDLLMKYNPALTCTLVGGNRALDQGLQYLGGANGKSLIMDAALMFGDDPYRYPENLPIDGAKGGPGGKPGCGSLPDVAKNWPVRALIANTGFGTGLDYRPNPGIGLPGYANYFPVTRGIPEPPSVRHPGPPAPGPVPGTDGYASPSPYGGPMYAPDGTPLYPGLPPAPPPGSPRDPGPPPPGSGPYVPPHPAEMQPTYAFQPPPPPKPSAPGSP